MNAGLSVQRSYRLPSMLAAGATDVGPVRRNNEDNFLLDEALGLVMVADGMGGHAAGEVASAGALTAMRAYLAQHAGPLRIPSGDTTLRADPDATRPDPAGGAVRLLHAAIAHANASLYEENRARGRADGDGMGTTLTGFWQPAGSVQLVMFHVGDSRLYRLRGGTLEQLSRDQTLYQQALEAGLFDTLPARNVLLQALGPSPKVTAEVRAQLVLPGDLLMLCSDGLHGSVPHAEIEGVLRALGADALEAACTRLVDLAYKYGGRDNITVVLAACRPGQG